MKILLQKYPSQESQPEKSGDNDQASSSSNTCNKLVDEQAQEVQNTQSDVEIDFNIKSASNNITIRKNTNAVQDTQTYFLKTSKCLDGFVPIVKKRKRRLQVLFSDDDFEDRVLMKVNKYS